MNTSKTQGLVITCLVSILIIGGTMGLQKYDKIINPHRAFQKDLKLQKEQQLTEQGKGEENVPNIEKQAFNKNMINILLLGVDSDEDRESRKRGYRSDSIIITSIDLDTKKVKMLSVPRDSYTVVPGNKNKDKINHAMAFGGGPKKKGNQYATEAVEGLLGINIHYYITVDMDVVKSIVDAIDGITIDVERNMDLGEEHLEKGRQKLNGDQTLIYLRNRDTPTGDFARMEQQQKFLMVLFQQAKENSKLPNVLPLYMKVRDKIYTNLKLDQIGALALLLKDLEPDNIETFTLTGRGIRVNDIYYLEIDVNHMEGIINEHFKDGGNIYGGN